jgi:hypothetical protein
MEYEAGDYRKLAVKQFPARSIRETAEGKYWKQFKAPVFAKQVSARALPGFGGSGSGNSSGSSRRVIHGVYTPDHLTSCHEGAPSSVLCAAAVAS